MYSSFYFIILFTLQLIFILRKAPSVWLLALWCLLFLVVFLFRDRLFYPQDHPLYGQRKRLVLLWLVLLGCLIGANVYLQCYLNVHERSYIKDVVVDSQQREIPIQLTGQITSVVEQDGNRIQFGLSVIALETFLLPYEEKILVTRYATELEEIERFMELGRGDTWQGMVLLNQPGLPRNPGAFSYHEYLYQQGIHMVGQVEGQGWSYEQDRSWKGRLIQHLDQRREGWMKQIERTFSAETAPMIKAMTIGYRDELDPILVSNYQQLGLIHVLAISGLHVGIILWTLYALLLKLPITREKVITVLFIFLPFYMFISGASVSVVRAGLMGMILLLCLRFRFWKNSVLGLFLVYVMLLVYHPFYIFNVGFQLSFLVTFGLIIAYPLGVFLFSSVPDKIRSLLTIAFIAQIVSLPILLYHFYQFSPYSFIINFLLVPIYSFVFIPGAFLFTALSYVNSDLVLLGVTLYERALEVIHASLEWVISLPYASLHTGRPSFWWLFFYLIAVLSMLITAERKHVYRAWLSFILLPLLVIIKLILPYLDSVATITILDVGQGDAIVIELPYRQEVIVIDVGGLVSFPKPEWQVRKKEVEVGRDIILPYLRYRGLNKIDKIIITHGHYDHFGGIQGLVGKISIDQLLRGPVAPHSDFEQEGLDKLINEGIPIYQVGRGDQWQTSDAAFQVLYPKKEANLIKNVGNIHDYNVVLWNQIYQTQFIWTGDVEEAGEQEIMRQFPELQVDVLKVAHHGSLTSTANQWLTHLQPQLSLISVGRNNRYGLPHPEIIARLEEQHIPTYRTDLDGGLMIKVYPHHYKLFPTLQRGGE